MPEIKVSENSDLLTPKKRGLFLSDVLVLSQNFNGQIVHLQIYSRFENKNLKYTAKTSSFHSVVILVRLTFSLVNGLVNQYDRIFVSRLIYHTISHKI